MAFFKNTYYNDNDLNTYETKHKIAEIKRIDAAGTIAVRWEGETDFITVDDPDIALYIVYTMTKTPAEVFHNINSMCR